MTAQSHTRYARMTRERGPLTDKGLFSARRGLARVTNGTLQRGRTVWLSPEGAGLPPRSGLALRGGGRLPSDEDADWSWEGSTWRGTCPRPPCAMEVGVQPRQAFRQGRWDQPPTPGQGPESRSVPTATPVPPTGTAPLASAGARSRYPRGPPRAAVKAEASLAPGQLSCRYSHSPELPDLKITYI